MGIYRKYAAITLLALHLGLSEGYLAIFRNGKPEQLLPYCQEVFTESDRAKLRQGIPFSTDRELSRLLEDFTS